MADGTVIIETKLNTSEAKSGLSRIKSAFQELGNSGGKGGLFGKILGANLVSAGIQKTIGSISGGLRSLTGELTESSIAWKTFDGNMRMIGKSSSEIGKVQKSLQDFATQTIYSASDMASTYSQMAAIGYDNTEKLVKGMGGLAASSEQPAQAMKTMSQQMTQALSKPTMQWQDFKLMMEQAPAGMAAVAKHMGMSLDEMVLAIQNGEISSKSFADAVAEVGTNADFSKMATQFKSAGQAMDGLRETLSNKLMPVFEKLDGIAIKAIEGITDMIGGIDFTIISQGIDTVLNKIKSFGKQAKRAFNDFMNGFKSTGTAKAFSSAMRSIGAAIKNVLRALRPANADFREIGKVVGEVAKVVADAAKKIADFVSKLDPGLIQGVIKSVIALKLAFVGLRTAMKIKNTFNVFRPLQEGFGGLGRSAGRSKSMISNTFNGIANIIKSAGTSIKSILSGTGTMLRGLGAGLSQAFKGIGDGIKSILIGLGKMTKSMNPVNMLAFAVAIGIVIAAFTLLATQGEGVKAILEGVGSIVNQLITGFGSLLGTLITSLGTAISIIAQGIATGIAMIITALGPNVQIIANMFVEITQVISNAIVQVVSALAPFIPEITRMVEIVVSNLPLIIAAFGELASNIGSAISEVVGAISSGVAEILLALEPLVETIGEQIQGIIKEFGAFAREVGQAISEVADAISTGAERIIGALTPLAETVLNGVEQIIQAFGDLALKVGEAIEKVNNSIANIIDSCTEFVEQIGSTAKDIAESFDMIVESFTKLQGLSLWDIGVGLARIGLGMNDILNAKPETIAQGLTTISDALANTFRVSALATDFEALGQAFAGFPSLESIGAGFTSIGTALGTIFRVSALATDFEALKQAMSGFPDLSGIASGLTSIGEAFNSINTNISSSLSSLSTIVSTTMTIVSNTVTQSFSAIVMTVSNSISSVQTAVMNSMNSIKTAVTNGFKQVVNSSNTGMSQFVSAISNKKGATSNAMLACINAAANIARSAIGIFISIGSQIGNGLAQGMYSALGAITAAANAMVAQANRAARAKARIKSPSRLFADAVGKFIPQGVATGIDKNVKYSNQAVENMISSMSEYKVHPEDLLGGGASRLKNKMKSVGNSLGVLGGSSTNATYNQNYTLNATGGDKADFFTPDNMKRLLKEFAYYVNLEGVNG